MKFRKIRLFFLYNENFNAYFEERVIVVLYISYDVCNIWRISNTRSSGLLMFVCEVYLICYFI